MILLGTIINVMLIIIGITFAIETQNILVVIISLIVGGILGEWIGIDAKLNGIGAFTRAIDETGRSI